MCGILNSGDWTFVWDDQQQVPYLYSGNQWISYDNQASIEIKAKLAVDLQLAGAMVWSVEKDDSKGNCGAGKYPLMNKIKQTLNGQ